MLTSNELELKANLSIGTLESNAEQIKGFVIERLKDYTPENYQGKAAEAKADRAVLNNAEKALNAKRLELERRYMEPFVAFKAIITDTCKAIKQASGQLDDIVKQEENREKANKEAEITAYWEMQKFSLFPLSQIFNDKWLNKGTKMKDIEAEIDQIIKKTFTDLKILEQFPKEDIPLLKTVYLDTLSISDAMSRAEQLKANRERLAREKTEREQLERKEQLEDQAAEERREQAELTSQKEVTSLVDEIYQTETEEELEEFALVFKGKPRDLINMKQYMTRVGITYDKLVDKGNGVYTKE